MARLSVKKTGFTVIELLIVVSIAAVIAGFVLIGFKNFASYQQFNQAGGDIKFILNQSQLYARSAVDDDYHGIRFSANSLTQFTGNIYSAADPDNVVTDYNLVTIQFDLVGGADEIVFDKLSGLPSATGTVTIIGVHYTGTTTIEILDSGVIE